MKSCLPQNRERWIKKARNKKVLNLSLELFEFSMFLKLLPCLPWGEQVNN
jgi:hypothetical protein